MATRTTSNVPTNITVTQSKGGHSNDEHSKATSGGPFPRVAVSGHTIEIWSDGAIWDVTSGAFLSTDQVKRNG
jgi:hypothetical protein